MPDLHSWTTQQVDETQRIAEAARGQGNGQWRHDSSYENGYVYDERDQPVVYDESAPLPEEAAHIALNDPASVLRRCAADRKILAEHRAREGGWYDWYACEGCGYDGADYCSEPMTAHVNDCPTLLALAEGYGLTEEQRAALDRPEPERPAPSGPGLIPPALAEAMFGNLYAAFLGTRPVEPRPEVKAIKILEPELKKIPGYIPATEEQP